MTASSFSAATRDSADHRAAPTIRFALRQATAEDHVAVDAAFERFALDRRDGYTAFLRAHAAALLPLEAAIDASGPWPGVEPRGDLLRADLDQLGVPTPDALPVTVPTSDAARWGMLYVLEGSRLGGAMLAKRVPADLPKNYLGAKHHDGSWQRFGAALDAAGAVAGAAWQVEAIAGAKAAFALFAAAALDCA